LELKILPEIEENLFPLQDDEYKFLEESILKDGIRDALVVWPRDGELILVDGHNRYKIAQKHNIPFKVVEKQFNDLDEVLEWIDFNQLGRRNLIDEQRTYVLGRLYERRKKKWGGDRMSFVYTQGEKFSPCSSSHATAREIAKVASVTDRTVQNAAEFAKAVDEIKEISPAAADRILKGELTGAITKLPKIKKKYPEVFHKVAAIAEDPKVKDVKLIEKEVRRIKPETSQVLPRSHNDDRLMLLNCDFMHADIQDESVDVILTDPPYAIDYKDDWYNLGVFANRVLKPSGFLISYFGQLNLVEFYNALSANLKYYWTMCLAHSGNKQLINARNVFCGWKPIIVFQKGPFKKIENPIDDIINGSGREKDTHEWQQGLSELYPIIDAFSAEGDIICDPFMGSGTTIIAALSKNRKSIGIEINKETFEDAKARINGSMARL